jgi:hypothetical protein
LEVRQGPYHVERTGSRPITEVKQHWARLVLGWVTAWESRVPLALTFCTIFALLRWILTFFLFHDNSTSTYTIKPAPFISEKYAQFSN